jgi:hypothetical protein
VDLSFGGEQSAPDPANVMLITSYPAMRAVFSNV